MDTVAAYAIAAVILGIPLLCIAAWLLSAAVECLTVLVDALCWLEERLRG